MSVKVTKLSKGADGLFIENRRFNTTLITFNFYLPLKKETAAVNGLLPFVLSSSSEKYPDFSKLNYKLNKLYGAKISSSTEKVGDLQLLKLGISVINDEFALDNEPLCEQACDLLLRLIFEPKLNGEAFSAEDTEREKRKAIEHIKGEISEKRVYAKKRLIEEMYKGDAYGVSKCGEIEDVLNITPESLYAAWVNMLKTARVRVNVVSSSLPSGLFEGITERFSCVFRENITDCSITSPTTPAKKVNTVTEEMDVSQGKLVMGFSSELSGGTVDTLPLLLMGDIFGGAPYSRLFTNVREKLSLCYYCAASTIKNKGLLTVDSGVEKQNCDKAEAEILKQLKVMQSGKFTDFEFESSIKGVTDNFLSFNDSQNALDIWYSVRINDKKLLTPEETAKRIKKVTREDIVNAAKGIKLHTVYKLLPKEENL